jgi:hypothetical protein
VSGQTDQRDAEDWIAAVTILALEAVIWWGAFQSVVTSW